LPPTPAVRVSAAPLPPAGPALAIGRTSVDLGSVDSTDVVDLTNTGGAPVDIRVGALPPWLTAVPGTTRLDPGFQTQLVITLDRAAAPVGTLDVAVSVTPARGTGGGTIRVSAHVAEGPEIVSVRAPGLRPEQCATEEAPSSGQLTVEVRDVVGIFRGELVTTGPDGQTATVDLTLVDAVDDLSTWAAPVGPVAAGGEVRYTVTVTDLESRVARESGAIAVPACP
ncbi:MAG: hypothetical protein IRZ08_02345, partial [Frankia sp.]|nr:hypothetical protein [Frankia sp.]